MADTGIFATTAEVLRKAGAGVSSTASAEAYTNQFMSEAESYINVATQYNYSDNYASLNIDKKAILKECASSLAAMYVINYDLTGMSKYDSQTRLNVLHDRIDKCIELLRIDLGKTALFIKAA